MYIYSNLSMSIFVDTGITYKVKQPSLRTTRELSMPSMRICVTGADTSGAWSGISEVKGANRPENLL
jgi:hypothetical protein